MRYAAAALKAAIDLLHFPSQVKRFRSATLPDEMIVLLRIASGDEETINYAAQAVGRSRETVRDAATFFVEQILLSPEADSYRVLGASPDATIGQLRRNMALLLRWLHPDVDRRGERTVFAARVTRAWNDLKTEERREAYDQGRKRHSAESLRRRNGSPNTSSMSPRSRKHKHPQNAGQIATRRRLPRYSGKSFGFLRRVLWLLAGRVAW